MAHLFTEDELAFLRQFVDDRAREAVRRAIEEHRAARQKSTEQETLWSEERLTSERVRELINKHETELRRKLLADGETFHIEVARRACKPYLLLRPHDLKLNSKGVPNWHATFRNAIDPRAWPDCPFVPTGRRGVWKFRPRAAGQAQLALVR